MILSVVVISYDSLDRRKLVERENVNDFERSSACNHNPMQ